MHMIWHYNGSVQIEQLAIAEKTGFRRTRSLDPGVSIARLCVVKVMKKILFSH